jgi:hypothetical protein
MTRFAAHLRRGPPAAEALSAAKAQYRRLLETGMKLASPAGLHEAVGVLQQCLTHVAMLKAICVLLDRGGGSRGSYCVLDESGEEMHPSLIDPATGSPYRFLPENEALRDEILVLSHDDAAEDLFDVRVERPRPIPHRDVPFETAWGEFREGRIYEP